MGLLDYSAWGESCISLSYKQLLQFYFFLTVTMHTVMKTAKSGEKCKVQPRVWGMSNYKTLYQEGHFKDFYNLVQSEISVP